MPQDILTKPRPPRPRTESTKSRGSIESDEGPAQRGKPGYRNSDEVESSNDARHDDPAGV